MNDYPCEDMRKLMEGESTKFPCEWVKENWSGGSSGSNTLIVTLTQPDPTDPVYVFDKTYQEVYNTMITGGQILIHVPENLITEGYRESYGLVLMVTDYEVHTTAPYGNIEQFSCASADGYPSVTYD